MLFVIFSLFTQSTFSAIPPQKLGENSGVNSLQVPFFRSPESLFPSGAISLATLQRQQINAKMKTEKFYKWKSQLFRVEELKPIRPVHLSKTVIDPKTNHRFKVTEANISQIKVRDEASKVMKTYQIDQLASDPYDMGLAITLTDAYLKKSVTENAKILTTIPQGQLLYPLGFEKGFVKVQYKDYVGYVRLSETITKFDLATVIYAQEKWQFVKRRDFDYMVTVENKKIHLSQIRGLVTPDLRGLIASPTQKIPMWSQVEVVNDQKPSWIESNIKGHGLVWWKPSVAADEIYTIDELLKKEISSVSFHPKNPLRGLLSAHGVFMTEDGYHWKKLSQFADFNGPVYYFNDLLIFVGHFRSLNGGKSFDNYIQIDKLASAIEYSLGYFPKRLQVKRIETLPPFRLKIEVDTGVKKIKMESPLFAQDWKVVRS